MINSPPVVDEFLFLNTVKSQGSANKMAIAIIIGLATCTQFESTNQFNINAKAAGRNCTLCKVNLAKANINI